MTRKNKKALLTSAFSVLLCLTMLVGTTFAWFTNSQTVTGNKITAGTLDIELYQRFYKADGTFTETHISNLVEPIFGDKLWEPGYVSFANIRIFNKGSLSSKVKANLIASKEMDAGVIDLANAIDVYICQAPLSAEGFETTEGHATDNADRLEGMVASGNATLIGSLRRVMEDGINLIETIIDPKKGDSAYLYIAMKMREAAGNEYQAAEPVTFDIRVMAVQATVEFDSFDNQYDAGADWPVFSQKEFTKAIKDAEDGDVIILGADIVLTDYIDTQGKKLTIDGNGKKLTLGMKAAFNRVNEGNLDGIAPGTQLTIKNLHFVGNGGGYAAIFGPSNSDGAAIIFDGCTFEKLYCAVYCGSQPAGSRIGITIRNCTYIETTWLYSVNPDSEDCYAIAMMDNQGVANKTPEIFN